MAPRQALLTDLRRDEGLRLEAYPDPLTHAAPWTIGYGHTGPEVHQGLRITQEQADQALFADASVALNACNRRWAWFAYLDYVRQDAVANMCFNMGIEKLSRFYNFIDFLAAGNYDAAAKDLGHTAWFKEVNGDGRASRIQAMILNGVRPDGSTD